jgi:hypothetical protein|tara:strand:+ start:113 stop:517 length:405 start_codon:yes stop_codon:yes gene_type:complete
MLTAHTIGSKYKEVANKPLTEITKLIRKDLKNTFKDCKFRVYKTHYSGLNIRLTYCKNPDRFGYWEGYNDKHIRLKNSFMKEIKEITDQYNFDNSDGMSDYFHVNFYANIVWDRQVMEDMDKSGLVKDDPDNVR